MEIGPRPGAWRIAGVEVGDGRRSAVRYDRRFREMARLELGAAERVTLRVLIDRLAGADDRGRLLVRSLPEGSLLADHRLFLAG